MRPASFVVLTQGDRPEELARAIASVHAQRDIAAEVVVVSNGAGNVEPPAGCQLVVSRENLGIPGGRNLGAANSTHEVMFFLDDDAWYPDDDVAGRVLDEFETNKAVGVVTLRIADPDSGKSEQRHVPRLRAGDPTRSSDVTTFLGGACAIRRRVFEECGPYARQFFYSHEESDLAWRAIDKGMTVRYRGDLSVLHPAAPPSRHPEYHYRSARNRVWLARRRLPWPIALPHVWVWTSRSLWNAGSAESRHQVWRGVKAGWTESAGERSPMSWKTVWRLTRLGRPPLI